jgi:BolA family transcriptional regulator, general stress-responsive regulator
MTAPDSHHTKNILERIEEHLEVLQPDSVELIDDSAKHAGHEGAKGGGGHFQLVIVSAQFENKSRQQRHRMIHAALGDMLEREIHAMAIKAYTPDEI